MVGQLTDGLGALVKKRDIHYIQGTAHLASRNEIIIKLVDGEERKQPFQNLVLATGSGPRKLSGIEVDHQYIIDSTDALELNRIPGSLLVIGGGYIGLELGSVFAALGSQVTVAEMTEGLLPGADRDLVAVLEKASLFEKIYFRTTVKKAVREKEGVEVSLDIDGSSETLHFDQVLVAAGRVPRTEDLGLENAGITVKKEGFVVVDDQRRTNVPGVFAIGDLTGEPLLAHKATSEGHLVAEVLAVEPGAGFFAKSIPAIVFTNPEIAWSGLTETAAREAGKEVEVLKFPWSASGRARTIGAAEGLTKLIVDPSGGQILGGAAAGKNAGSLISEISLAIELGATAEDLALTIHPHPTLSETIMEAAENFLYGTTHLFPRK